MGIRDYLIRNAAPGENLPPVVGPTDTARSRQQIRDAANTTPTNTGDIVTKGFGEQYTPENVFSKLIEKQYKESEADIKRRRAADFWGNLATVVGQTFAASRGARQFTPVKPNTEFYNDKLSQLKNWRNQVDLNKTLTDYNNEFLLKRDAAKQQYEYSKQVALEQIKNSLEAGLIDRRTAANLELQVQKAKDAKELEKVKQENRISLADKKIKAAKERANIIHSNNSGHFVEIDGNTYSQKDYGDSYIDKAYEQAAKSDPELFNKWSQSLPWNDKSMTKDKKLNFIEHYKQNSFDKLGYIRRKTPRLD